jgi:tetratricopeptide (TPR) repeat protein
MSLGRIILASAVTVLLVAELAAGLPQSETAALFQKAGMHYENAEYLEAVQDYQAILEVGGRHPAVYYNLANSYFKAGMLGRAILNFERALSLAPRDEEIRTNLELARGFLADKLPELGSSRLLSALSAPHKYTSLNETTLLVSVSYALIMLAAAVLVLTRKARGFWVIMISVLTVVLGYFSISLGSKLMAGKHSEAIIVVPETEVRSGPGDDFILEFTLHEGTKVRLENVEEDWSRIELAGARRGWLPTDAVETIW